MPKICLQLSSSGKFIKEEYAFLSNFPLSPSFFLIFASQFLYFFLSSQRVFQKGCKKLLNFSVFLSFKRLFKFRSFKIIKKKGNLRSLSFIFLLEAAYSFPLYFQVRQQRSKHLRFLSNKSIYYDIQRRLKVQVLIRPIEIIILNLTTKKYFIREVEKYFVESQI